MATGLESAFDQEEEKDVFALETAPAELGAGSGYRGEPVVEPVVEADPFVGFNRSSISGQDIDVTYSDDPSLNQDQRSASDLEYKEYTDDVVADVTFDTVEARGGDYSNFGSRLISGETDEYDNVYSYNNMLSRGLDVETAKQWQEEGGTAQDANNLIANKFLTDKDSFTNAFDSFRTEGDMVGFKNQWGQADFNGKVAYLENLNANGELEDEQYKKAWRDEWNRSQEGNPNATYIIPIKAPRDFDPNESTYNAPDTLEYKAGDTVYVTYTPNGINPEGNMGVVQNNTYFPNKNSEGLELQYHDNIGPKTTNLAEASTWLQFRDEFVIPAARTTLAAATGGLSEAAVVAVKGLSGETLKGSDWATLAMAGANLSGITTPPTEVLDPSTGQMVMSAGTGIGGLSYAQTNSLVNALGTGNPTSFLLQEFGGDFIASTLDKMGINSDNMSPEVLAGVGRTVDKLILGEDFDKALQSGVGEWARESGIGDELEGTLRTVGRDLDDKYLQPIKEALPEGARLPDTPEDIKAIEDAVKVAGSSVGDVTDPLFSTVGDVGSAVEDIARPVGSVVEDLARPVGSVIDDYLLQPAKTLLGVGAGLLLGGGGGLSGTRTTDSLFRDELFKFKEKDFGLVERVTQDAPKEQLADFNDDPFASDFNNRNLFG